MVTHSFLNVDILLFYIKQLDNFQKMTLIFWVIQVELKLSAVRKVPETIKFQALGIIESKTVWETVLAWAQKLKSEEAQYKLNTGFGLCQKDKFS